MSALPQKQTLELSWQMSALCQKRTHALQQKCRAPLRWYGFDDAHYRFGRHNLREPEPSLLKQSAVLRFRPFLTAGDCKHGHVLHLAGVRRVAGRQYYLDDEQAAVRADGAATDAKYCEALSLTPIVDDVREQINTIGDGNALKKAAGFDGNTVGQTARPDQRRRICNDMWQVEKYATRFAMVAQDRREQIARRTADVDHGLGS